MLCSISVLCAPMLGCTLDFTTALQHPPSHIMVKVCSTPSTLAILTGLYETNVMQAYCEFGTEIAISLSTHGVRAKLHACAIQGEEYLLYRADIPGSGPTGTTVSFNSCYMGSRHVAARQAGEPVEFDIPDAEEWEHPEVQEELGMVVTEEGSTGSAAAALGGQRSLAGTLATAALQPLLNQGSSVPAATLRRMLDTLLEQLRGSGWLRQSSGPGGNAAGDAQPRKVDEEGVEAHGSGAGTSKAQAEARSGPIAPGSRTLPAVQQGAATAAKVAAAQGATAAATSTAAAAPTAKLLQVPCSSHMAACAPSASSVSSVSAQPAAASPSRLSPGSHQASQSPQLREPDISTGGGAGGPAAARCAVCGATQPKPSRCARCRSDAARYCSTECQTRHGPHHKVVCKPAGRRTEGQKQKGEAEAGV